MAFEGALFGSGRASVAEMAAAHFVAKVIVSGKVLGVAKVLIQGYIALASFRDRSLIGFDGAMAASEKSPNVLGRRRRREGALEKAERGGGEAGVGGRGVLEEIGQRAGTVEWEIAWGFGGFSLNH